MTNYKYPDFIPAGILGDVDGPASSTDNAVVRFDGLTGKKIQNSVVTLSDTGVMAGITDLSATRVAFGSDAVIGLSGADGQYWDFSQTVTDFTAATSWAIFNSAIQFNPSVDLIGGNAKFLYGQQFDTSVKAGNIRNFEFVNGMAISTNHNGTGLVTAQAALYVNSYVTSSGSATDNIGEFIGAGHSGIGNIGHNICVYYRSGHSGSGGSITLDETVVIDSPDAARPLATHIGLKIEDQTNVNITTAFAIYSEGGKSYHAGALGLGTQTAPVSNIDIIGVLNSTPFISMVASSVTATGPMLSGNFGTYGGSSVRAVSFTGVLAGGMEFLLANTSASASASAGTRLRLSAAVGAGDLLISHEIGAKTIIAGVDNSDSKYKIGSGAVFGISDTLTVDTANVRVGINNASPAVALDVTGAITGTGLLTSAGLSSSSALDFTAGVAVTNGNYQVIRDNSGTNVLKLNVPSGSQVQATINGAVRLQVGGSSSAIVQGTTASGAQSAFTISCATLTGQTASTEINDFHLNNTRTITSAAGAVTAQRSARFGQVTYAFNSASTIADAASLAVLGAPIAGTNATITRAMAIWAQAGVCRFDGGIQFSAGGTTYSDTNITSGVYTPTLTNVANLDGSTAFECQYLRVGSTVTVSGKVSIDPTLAATSTQLGISLPIASNIGAQEDCAGAAFASGIAAQGAAILGDAANNRAQMEFISADLTNQPMYFSFSYQVI